jgi:hypothetical protein
MKRKWLAALSLVMAALLLTACTAQQPSTQTFAEVTQYLGPAPTATQAPVSQPADSAADGGQSVFASNPFDVADGEADPDAEAALLEEENADDGVYDGGDTVVYGAPDPNATVYPYAGSSPIPLNPVDAPTATPRAPLSFTYVPYAATALGLTFDGPAGWVPDESVNEAFTLSEPEQQLKDGQLGVINLYAVPVNSNYTEANLTTEIKQRLSTIGATNFVEWSPSLTATRFLMGGKGVYANYSGTLANGVKVGGRIHATAIDGVLYCLQITYPLGFKDDYLNVFSKIRETLKRSK